ncbi:hypothetical protein SCAR479_10031 [Seiridium cardinale]|uniref:Peptidase S33 tripeptidyl aminopeptidase-like C-terminal domain-containing protein n=1 Tax=Seiridium cardinale TaxID=138064 RepID=A0ABR2XI12_9PEZI
MALPEAGLSRAAEAPQPEVVRAVDLEDRNRDRRSCVAGAGGNVCTNGPYLLKGYATCTKTVTPMLFVRNALDPVTPAADKV